MDEDVTRPLVQVAPPPVATLQLCFGETQYACGRERPVVRFGRSRDNDVVVIDDFASRRHGEIMHRSGRFFVTDHSSNGTLLMRASGHSTHFQGETFALDGSGTLRCGHRDGPAIAFVVVAPTALPSGESAAVEPDPGPPASTAFYREGDYWTLAYDGVVLRLKHAKGLGYLARCCAIEPGDPRHGSGGRRIVVGGRHGAARYEQNLAVDHGSGAGPALDATARARYQLRVQELREEISTAERCNDPGRTAAARAELEFIAEELTRSVGLGGRDREAASNAERARVAVTLAIKSSLEKIRNCHPALGAHLRNTIKRGRFCSYQPEPAQPVDWTLDP
jgi:hypothetical protein